MWLLLYWLMSGLWSSSVKACRRVRTLDKLGSSLYYYGNQTGVDAEDMTAADE